MSLFCGDCEQASLRYRQFSYNLPVIGRLRVQNLLRNDWQEMDFQFSFDQHSVTGLPEVLLDGKIKWAIALKRPTDERKTYFCIDKKFVGQGWSGQEVTRGDLTMVLPAKCDASPNEREIMLRAIRFWEISAPVIKVN